MVRPPTPEQPRSRPHDPAVGPVLDDRGGPRVNAVALDLGDPLEAGRGRELARRGRWAGQVSLVGHEGWLALKTASSRPGKRCSSSSAPEPVEPALALDPLGDNSGLTQHPEVMGAGGLGDRNIQRAAGLLAACQRAGRRSATARGHSAHAGCEAGPAHESPTGTSGSTAGVSQCSGSTTMPTAAAASITSAGNSEAALTESGSGGVSLVTVPMSEA